MDIDPKLYQQLLETFSAEFEEDIQEISDTLLKLEKKPTPEEQTDLVNVAFRVAHNIKGASRSVEVENVGLIGHRLEDIFSVIRQGEAEVTSDLIDLSLEATDRMKDAFQAFMDKQELSFDLADLLIRLTAYAEGSSVKKDDAQAELPVEEESVQSSDITLANPECSPTPSALALRLLTGNLSKLHWIKSMKLRRYPMSFRLLN